MRSAAVIMIPFFIVALVLGAIPASAWKESILSRPGCRDLFSRQASGDAIDLYLILAKGLPAMVYSAEDDHVVYKLTVVDLTSRPDAGANFVNGAAYELIRQGDVLFTDFTRVYQGARSIHGVTVVVDRPDGKRVRTSLYYNKGRLYIAEAIVLPARGDKDMTTPSRYDQTIRFPPDGRFD